MQTSLSSHSTKPAVVTLSIILLCIGAPGFTRAQVSVHFQDSQLQIINADYGVQQVVRVPGKSRTSWVVTDNVGNVYEASGYLATTGSDDPEDEPVIVIGGYQSGGDDDPEDDPVVVIGGYQRVIDILVEDHGMVITKDPVLGVELVTLPGEDDPIERFFEIVTTDSLEGYPLIAYFGLLEVNSKGVFDVPPEKEATPYGQLFSFPNDPYYLNQWNLLWTRLANAQWHPAEPKKQVRISVIDSGIRLDDRAHTGLDGTSIHYEQVAPEFGYAVPHALEIVTLLGDQNNDGDGIAGLLGDNWAETGCYSREPLLAKAKPRIDVYNVGEFAPISVFVARAITKSIRAGADVINLSLALGYSPLVERTIKEAIHKGVIVVAAAGNYSSRANSRPAKFPANIDGVISVGAADISMLPSHFSANRGVDIYAPGDHLVAGGPDDLWVNVSGTSFAAPHVTATVAMMRAVKPNLTPKEALRALQIRAQGRVSSRGIGFLNALSALNHVLPKSERVRRVPAPHECGIYDPGSVDSAEKSRFIDTEIFSFTYDDSIDDDLFGDTTVRAENVAPKRLALTGNFPNPFNPTTAIQFTVPERQDVRLTIYNTLGQEIITLIDGEVEAGTHSVPFDGSGLPSGLYIARISSEKFTQARTITLLK